MAYSPLGVSLPQLVVTGYSAPTASYGAPFSVDINVENLGAASLIEPRSLAPGSPSSADAAASTVNVYASATPNAKSGYLLLGTVAIPSILQNSEYETVSTLVLPTRHVGFPSSKFYLTLAVNNDRSILQNSTAGNVYHVPKAVQIVAGPLPDLQVVGFDIPQPLQPGDVVSPTIRIENFGTGDPGTQGPVTVALVASLDKKFNAGSVVLATFTIPSLPGTSEVPTQSTISAIQNLFTTPNEYTTTLAALKLPTTPGFYYLGIKIDPTHHINQTYGPNSALSLPVPVGPAGSFLPPATIQPGTAAPVFPALPLTFVNTTGLGQVPLITPINPSGPITVLASTSTVSAASVGPTSSKAHRSGRGK